MKTTFILTTFAAIKKTVHEKNIYSGKYCQCAHFSTLGWIVWPGFWWILGFLCLLILVGIKDMVQQKHTLWRNFPVLGRLRWLMEAMRPKLYQYFVKSDTDGMPINRLDRSTIYQRAKKQVDTMPFGTQMDLYAEGYEWMTHSIAPKDYHKDESPSQSACWK